MVTELHLMFRQQYDASWNWHIYQISVLIIDAGADLSKKGNKNT